ncbi:hypothetical protein EDD71_11729 [Fonticella tunisiensis]|uniref:Uncharacterized protein n=1 Tax=Fonticella tunisiensis TaxID=1096341 RepID=A0A4R7KAJ9_9CLOT|nr:hypothetical protein EDD71_11729 [Fonticella tunisiensis]
MHDDRYVYKGENLRIKECPEGNLITERGGNYD